MGVNQAKRRGRAIQVSLSIYPTALFNHFPGKLFLPRTPVPQVFHGSMDARNVIISWWITSLWWRCWNCKEMTWTRCGSYLGKPPKCLFTLLSFCRTLPSIFSFGGGILKAKFFCLSKLFWTPSLWSNMRHLYPPKSAFIGDSKAKRFWDFKSENLIISSLVYILI